MKRFSFFKKQSWLLTVAALALVGLAFGIAWTGFRSLEQEKDSRSRFRQAVARWFPDAAAEVAESYGLHYKKFDSAPEIAAVDRVVVLVHGLDDPGKIWMNLAPALTADGYDVWVMSYPNDQPVTDSAKFFADQLQILREMGAARISLVAHSMGGLVSREMLTRPDIGYARQAESGQLPQVSQLIMVGTPNHGSQLARFRFLTEFRDQWILITSGRWHWLGWILDGAGEAKIDLLPGSRFLAELNARPHPAGVDLSVIAGVVGASERDDIRDLIGQLESNLPAERQELVTELQDWFERTTEEIGDGLVSVDSARLPGVPFYIVPGTHLTMIRNFTEQSDRVPPAVPVIQKMIGDHFKVESMP